MLKIYSKNKVNENAQEHVDKKLTWLCYCSTVVQGQGRLTLYLIIELLNMFMFSPLLLGSALHLIQVHIFRMSLSMVTLTIAQFYIMHLHTCQPSRD